MNKEIKVLPIEETPSHTESAAAEADRRETEDQYRALFENAVIGIYQATPDGCLITANAALAELLGYSSAEQMAASVTSVAQQIHVDPERHAELAHRLENEGSAAHFETEFLRRDGTRIWVSQHAGAVRGRQGELLSHEVFVHDITAKKELEAQALHAQRMDSIGTLTSGVAHDLNNVLTPIMACASMLNEEFLDAEQRQSLVAMIETSVGRGAEILRQVLAFGRGIEGDRQPLEVASLIKETVSLISETFPKHVGIQHFVAPDLWSITGDATQMHQVLLNLCVNARDAMPVCGTLSVRASNLEIDDTHPGARRTSARGPHVVLEVSDTGTGIAPDVLERIFDPFFTTKPKGKGTGLGLSTSLAIVKSHGGFLHIQSELHRGTTFKVFIPAAVEAAARKTEMPISGALPKGNGELVLIVDDERAVRSIAKAVLEAHGYRTLVAGNGIEALSIFATSSERIAVVLTDVGMPEMDGIELIQALRRQNNSMRVIASTGETEDLLSTRANELKLDGLLKKPYRTETLLRAIHAAIHTSGRGENLAAAG